MVRNVFAIAKQFLPLYCSIKRCVDVWRHHFCLQSLEKANDFRYKKNDGNVHHHWGPHLGKISARQGIVKIYDLKKNFILLQHISCGPTCGQDYDKNFVYGQENSWIVVYLFWLFLKQLLSIYHLIIYVDFIHFEPNLDSAFREKNGSGQRKLSEELAQQ